MQSSLIRNNIAPGRPLADVATRETVQIITVVNYAANGCAGMNAPAL